MHVGFLSTLQRERCGELPRQNQSPVAGRRRQWRSLTVLSVPLRPKPQLGANTKVDQTDSSVTGFAMAFSPVLENSANHVDEG
jgi:hypothetical protein